MLWQDWALVATSLVLFGCAMRADRYRRQAEKRAGYWRAMCLDQRAKTDKAVGQLTIYTAKTRKVEDWPMEWRDEDGDE